MARLKTEQNTRTIERQIRGAFRKFTGRRTFTTVYEHGQWWTLLECNDGTHTYSVHDAEGVGSINGFGFERV